MAKQIDPMDIKTAIENGQLEVVVKKNEDCFIDEKLTIISISKTLKLVIQF